MAKNMFCNIEIAVFACVRTYGILVLIEVRSNRRAEGGRVDTARLGLFAWLGVSFGWRVGCVRLVYGLTVFEFGSKY